MIALSAERRRSVPLALGAAGCVAAGLAAGLVIAAVRVDFAAAVWLLPGVVLWLVLAAHPPAAVGTLVTLTMLLEDDSQGFLPSRTEFYRRISVSKYLPPLSASDMLLVAVIVGLGVQILSRRREMRTAGPFTLPLLLLAAATLVGAFSGRASDVELKVILEQVVPLAYLVVLPFAVVQVIPVGDGARRVLQGVTVLVALKSAEGLFSWITGAGRPIQNTTLTFYSPTANWLLLAFALAVLAALAASIRLPAWVYGLGALAAVVLVLSFRRSFWIGGALGFVLVLLLGSGRRGRIRTVAVAVVVIGAGWAVLTLAGLSGPQGAIVERGRLLRPSATIQPDDRYRIQERRNVMAEITRNPFSGLGLAVPWTARYPLPDEHPGGRLYAHVLVLWYWIRLGCLGVAAYVWLMAAALLTAYRLWKRHADGVMRAVGGGLVGAIAALAVVETTASFSGVYTRFTVVFAAALGWLAAAVAVPDQPADRDVVRVGAGS